MDEQYTTISVSVIGSRLDNQSKVCTGPGLTKKDEIQTNCLSWTVQLKRCVSLI